MFLYLPKSNSWQALKSLWREATIKSIVSVFILSWPKSQFKRFSQNRQKECFLFMSWFSFHRPLLQVSSEVAKASTAKEEEEKILLLVTFPLFCSRIWVDCNLLLDPKVRTSSLWLLALYVRVYNVLLSTHLEGGGLSEAIFIVSIYSFPVYLSYLIITKLTCSGWTAGGSLMWSRQTCRWAPGKSCRQSPLNRSGAASGDLEGSQRGAQCWSRQGGTGE